MYKPDPVIDPVSKQELIEVNAIQRIEANAETVLATISSTSVSSNVLTVIVSSTASMRVGQQVIFRNLTDPNDTYLNGQVVTINRVTPTTFTANYTVANYSATSEGSAQVIDTTNRTLYIFYAETTVSTSQAPQKYVGAVAARFIYDLEALFQ